MKELIDNLQKKTIVRKDYIRNKANKKQKQ